MTSNNSTKYKILSIFTLKTNCFIVFLLYQSFSISQHELERKMTKGHIIQNDVNAHFVQTLHYC